jgi:hypothetical protein
MSHEDIYSTPEIRRILAGCAWAARTGDAIAGAWLAFGGGPDVSDGLDRERAETPNQRMMREMRECRKRLTSG